MARSVNRVVLSDDDVRRLRGVLGDSGAPATMVRRCRVLLALDEARPPVPSHAECAKTCGVSLGTVGRVAREFASGGVDAVLARRRSPNSDQARRKMDGRAEARLVEVACGPAPEGRARWTLRLLEEEMKVVLDEPVGRETIRRTLKKTRCAPTGASTGACPRRRTPRS